MIALYLLASHMVGDFVFQTRWQAAGKFDRGWLWVRHGLSYTLAFVPVAFYEAFHLGHGWKAFGVATAFLEWLFIAHLVTDSRRFHSTLGDVIGWRWFVDEYDYLDTRLRFSNSDRDVQLGERRGRVVYNDGDRVQVRFELEPNPWPAMPLAIDQTLHVVQIALLGAYFFT